MLVYRAVYQQNMTKLHLRVEYVYSCHVEDKQLDFHYAENIFQTFRNTTLIQLQGSYKNINKMQTNNPVSPRQEEYRKIFCAYHKTQFLTNFCVHKSCLMPLCPSCIVEHTEEHYRQPSKPLYMNLHEALYDVKQSCLNNIHEFENFARRLDQLSEFKRKLVQEVHNQLLQHKQNIYLHIQRLFMQFQQEVYNIVVADYDSEGLYKENDINQFEYKVKDVINELYQKISLVKSDQCLPALILFYGEQRQRINQIKAECNAYILKHDKTKIDTYLDENAMKKQLQNLFSNVVEVQKILVEKSRIYEPLQRRTPEKNQNLLNSSISQSRKSKIFHQSGSKYESPNKYQSDVRRQKLSKYGSALR